MKKNAIQAISCFKEYQTEVAAAFYGRTGGVVKSEDYGTLSCAFKNYIDTKDIVENRKIVAQHIGKKFGKYIFGVKQNHAFDAYVLAEYPQYSKDFYHDIKADAIITTLPNILISVLTADCCPILGYSPSKKFITVIHAGWRGALGNNTDGNIIKNTFGTLNKMGVSVDEMKFAVGPCIYQENYEVGPEFMDRFVKQDVNYQRFFLQEDGKRPYFDLPKFVLYRLKECGAKHISTQALEDTFSNKEKYFSYRRAWLAQHRQNKSTTESAKQIKSENPIQYGCQISAIGMFK